jgi:hypothetical protein
MSGRISGRLTHWDALSMGTVPRLLVTVTDVFVFTDGTLNIAPLVPFAVCDREPGEQLKQGDQLELRGPDGKVIKTTLYQLGLPYPSQVAACIQLVPPVTKEDLAPGTQIWKLSGPE